jgi:hypothetical protein
MPNKWARKSNSQIEVDLSPIIELSNARRMHFAMLLLVSFGLHSSCTFLSSTADFFGRPSFDLLFILSPPLSLFTQFGVFLPDLLLALLVRATSSSPSTSSQRE